MDFRSIVFTIIIILVTTIAVRGSNNMIQTTIPLLAHYNFSFSKFTVGILSALFGLTSFITTTFLNPHLRSSYRRFAFIASSITYTFILFLYFYSDSLMIWPLTASAGAAVGFMMPNLITSAGLFEDRRIRERSISLYTTALSVSLILGPVIESYILSIYSLRYAFLFFVPFGLTAAFLSPFIRFPDDGKRKRRRFTAMPGFRTAVFLNLSYVIPFVLITVFAGIYAHTTLGASYSTVTVFYSLFFATSFMARLTLTLRKPSENLWSLVTLTMLLTLAGILLMFVSGSMILFAVTMALLGIPHGLSFPISLLYVSRSYEPEARSTANSYIFSTMTIVIVLGTVMGGIAVQDLGFRFTFLILLPAIVTLMLLTYYYGKPGKNSADAGSSRI